MERAYVSLRSTRRLGGRFSSRFVSSLMDSRRETSRVRPLRPAMTLLAAALLATAFLATTPSRATAQVGTTPSGSVPAGVAGSSTAPAPDSVMSMPSTPSSPAPRVRESLLETFYLFAKLLLERIAMAGE